MTISHVNSTTFAGTSTTDTSVTNNVPSGVVDGDLLLWAISGGSALPATPSGWSSWAAAVNTNRLTIFYRFASSEPASYTASGLTAGTYSAIMSAYRGVDQTTPQDATPLTGTSSVPSITTVTPNAYALSHGKCKSASGVTNTVWTSTNGSVAGTTTTTLGASTNDTSGAMYMPRPTPGAIQVNCVPSGTGQTTQCRISSALRPAAITGDASRTVTAALTSDSVVTRPVSATEAVTAGLTADSVRTGVASATEAVTAGLTADSVLTRGADAVEAVTAGLTADSTVTRPVDASEAVTAGLTSTGFITRPADASEAITAALDASAVLDRHGDASAPVTALLDASAALTRAVDADLGVTVGLSASAEAHGNRLIDANLDVTADLAATVALTTGGDSAEVVTAGLTATAAATRPGDAVGLVTVGLVASASVNRGIDAALTVGVAFDAVAAQVLTSDAHLAVAAHLAATVPTPPSRTVDQAPGNRTVLMGAQNRTETVVGRGPASRTVSAT